MTLPPHLRALAVEILWADLPLWLATRYVDDKGATIWDVTRPAILERMGGAVTWDSYDDLTVAEHAQLMDHCGIPWPNEEVTGGVE